MDKLLIELELSIKDLKKINDEIVFGIDHRAIEKLEREKSNLITVIDDQCKKIKLELNSGKTYEKNNNDNDRKKFIDLIKKYVIIQENYKNAKKNLLETQLLVQNPNLTKIEIHNIMLTQTNTKLCLANETYNYVHARHKDILKLEKDINEIKELAIAMYAVTELQGETIDRIAEKTNNAKENCHEARVELTEAYKIKNKKKWFII